MKKKLISNTTNFQHSVYASITFIKMRCLSRKKNRHTIQSYDLMSTKLRSSSNLIQFCDSYYLDNGESFNIKLIRRSSELQKKKKKRFLREKPGKRFHLIRRVSSWDDGNLSSDHLFNTSDIAV